MIGIRPDTWQIHYFDAVEPTDGSQRYYIIAFRNDGTNWRNYWLIWEPETGLIEGRVSRETVIDGWRTVSTKPGFILPRKMTLAMAHRAGIIPECALNTKTYRPEYWEPKIKDKAHERPPHD